MNRRDFVRRGALWTLSATIVTPEVLERLTWKRKLWLGATLTEPLWVRLGDEFGECSIKYLITDRRDPKNATYYWWHADVKIHTPAVLELLRGDALVASQTIPRGYEGPLRVNFSYEGFRSLVQTIK